MKLYLHPGKLVASALLCLLALAAGDVSAASLTVNGWTLGETVGVIYAGQAETVATAELDLTVGGVRGFGYCVDLAQSIGPGASAGWDLRAPELSDSVIRAAWLVDTFRPELAPAGGGSAFGVTRATAIAALQVAVWEVMAETPGNYNLADGAFSLADGGASDGVRNLSRDFLVQLGRADLVGYQTSALWAVSKTRQDQLFYARVNPIPEPGTVALYLFGAAIVAFGIRRKAA